MSVLADRVLAGDPRAVARAISLVESGNAAARPLAAALAGRTGRAFVTGVTGPPGAGKSTLVDRLIAAWRRQGRTVGVIAVDPSSPFSGGAILGDRIRMQAHAEDAGVFIRSMAARGVPGGLAHATGGAVDVLDAAGFDLIVVETVGVGQAEVDVARLVDLVLVILVPGAGDDIQTLKAGLMEAADIFVVNQADREGASRVVAALEGMLAEEGRPPGAWSPRVMTTVATSGEGLDALVELTDVFRRDAESLIATRRQARRERGLSAGERMRIDHLGVAVERPDALLAFLHDAFGVEAAAPEHVPGAGVRVRFVEADGAALEIVEPGGPDSPIAHFLATRGPGLHHVAVRVSNLEEALARLRARGVRLIDDTPRRGAHGTRIAFVHPASAGGVLVELVER